ncbi:MAG: TIGR04255 family protein, partial [Alcaligenaceae bacterium]
MSLTFDVAPLVEIIAEVRWSDPTAFMVPGPLMGLSQPSNATDEFFMRFGGRAYGSGFQRAERLVPPGFPVPIGQVVYRYRPPEDFHDEMARSALWQVGPGVFTANAVPPYRSWVEFSPLVRAGLEVLFETRPADVRNSPVSSVSLRYVDAFNHDLIGDSTFEKFLAEKLGFQVLLP